MNIVDKIINTDKQNSFFGVKIFLSAILLFIWLINSEFFTKESDVIIAIALLISTLTLIVYGIIFKNQTKIENILLVFLLFDILIVLILVFPLYHSHYLFYLIALTFIASNFIFIKPSQQIYTLIFYFSLAVTVVALNDFSDSQYNATTIITSFFIFNGICYFAFYLFRYMFDNYKNKIVALEKDNQNLLIKQGKIDKEIKLSNQRLEYLSKDLKRKSFEIQNILHLTDKLGDNTDSKTIISSFLLTMAGQLGCSHVLYLSKQNSSLNYYSVLEQKGVHDEQIKKVRIYQDSFLIQMLKSTKEPMLISKIPIDRLYKDEQELLKMFYNDLINPIIVRNNIIGIFIIGEKLSGSIFTQEDLNLVSILTNHAAFILDQSKISEEIYDFYNKSVKTLIRTQELKDTYSKGHAIRTAQYVHAMGSKMRLANDQLRNLTYGTILHDIGKIAIKDEILMYSKKFNGNNTEIKQKILEHTLIGASILKSVGFDESLIDMALHHHEWFNGEGYPHNLIKEQISLESRILSLCNAFDAMLSNKPYRKSFGKDWVLDQIQKKAGSQFDPEIVSIFLDEISSNTNLIKLANRG